MPKRNSIYKGNGQGEKLGKYSTITNDNMTVKIASIWDTSRAASMQISIWRWEMHMIAKYGLRD
jgi:hypothetical protein